MSPIEIVSLAEPDIDLRRCLDNFQHRKTIIFERFIKKARFYNQNIQGIPEEGCPALPVRRLQSGIEEFDIKTHHRISQWSCFLRR
jgi:hypothetical protein